MFNGINSIIKFLNSNFILTFCMEAENVPHSIRSCKDCVHKMVCEARRTLYRSLTQFDKEFGDMVDIGVIHNENDSCIDLLAKSCKHYLSPKDDGR